MAERTSQTKFRAKKNILDRARSCICYNKIINQTYAKKVNKFILDKIVRVLFVSEVKRLCNNFYARL